ncbi:MAG: M23 family metallopeptidase [Rickettsiales bacterium]|nr:M23 family metallopeptidase [Rickettsiales bacterium]MDR2830894.1 M23 family metallopeptidase [Candidatus Methanovirga basalitermitum]
MHKKDQQKDFLQAIFNPSLSIEQFKDGTSEGQSIYDFILFSREKNENITQETVNILLENNIENVEMSEDLSKDEIKNSDKIMKDKVILRIEVVFYSLYLHEFCPVSLYENDDEIWNDIVDNSQKNYKSWEDINLPDYKNFVSSFFVINSEIEKFLWHKTQDNSSETQFENIEIYKNIYLNINREVTDNDKKVIEFIWDFLTKKTLIDFTGEYAPPVDVNHFGDITSLFGNRIDPITGNNAFHNGVDFAWNGCLGANIYAITDGKIIRASDANDGFGLSVILEHSNGWQSIYAHCSQIYVKLGDEVEAGELIAAIGSSGRSTGAHLHLGLKINGSWQDPMQLYT